MEMVPNLQMWQAEKLLIQTIEHFGLGSAGSASVDSCFDKLGVVDVRVRQLQDICERLQLSTSDRMDQLDGIVNALQQSLQQTNPERMEGKQKARDQNCLKVNSDSIRVQTESVSKTSWPQTSQQLNASNEQ